jgi:hypothetical protein
MTACTILGLSSARGQKLNIYAGIVKATDNEVLTERIAVIIDGQHDPLSIKLENLELLANLSKLDLQSSSKRIGFRGVSA